MIGFKFGDLCPSSDFLGAALLLTSNKKLNNPAVSCLVGNFLALNLMGDAVGTLKSVTAFKDYLATLVIAQSCG